MQRILLARHGESAASVRGVVNGDPAVEFGLTSIGERQSLALGRAIADEPIDLCITSQFERCEATARIALEGRRVRYLASPLLGDMRVGRYEGGPLDDYLRWAHATAAIEPAPGGGESRADVARRFANGIDVVLAQPETTALVVCHQLTIAYVGAGVSRVAPPKRINPVPYAEPVAFTTSELEHAAAFLRNWADSPDW
jgi:broad specificity phosphatase PhoE